MGISDAGRRGVRQLVRELEEAVDVDELRSHAVRGLARLIPADGAQWYHFAAHDGAVRALAFPAESFHTDPAVIYDHPVDHPLTGPMLLSGTGGAWRVSDVAGDRDWRLTHCYNLDFRPFGMHRHLVASGRDETGVSGYALLRGGSDFTEEQRDLLGYAQPHFAAAERLLTERQRMYALLAAALASAGRSGQGVAAVAGDGTVRALDAVAAELLPRLDGDPRIGVGALPGACRAFRARDIDVRGVECAVPDVPRLLLLRDLAPGRAAARALGLTEREHRTLEHIDAGRTPVEAARAMGISLTTVRGYVAALHRKLNAGHTAALLRAGREAGLLGE
ncbi:response regulator transcription factor [Streptomyces sp. NPDC102360]|uniref:helix-turn-helix transcriptional regulator n=1 Tax=Streptomyces sp. NPDC102360 TaxID=3366160 RepID=UPI00382B3B85